VRLSGLAQTDAFKDDPYFPVIQQAAAIAQFPPFVPQYTAVIETIWTAIQKVVQGDASVKDALDEAAAATNDLLAPAP
jgi:ABC-type glycerol-3-phosphate transport system substrate-binding protein